MLLNHAASTALLLRKIGSHAPGKPEEHAPGSSPELDDFSGGEQIVCRRCGALITAAGQRIEVNGQHEHMFTNPEGIVFHIGCFARVRGCLFAGQPTGEWSWFKGYMWRVAYCNECGLHLGWRFSSGEHVFHGLVLHNLSRLS